MKENPEGKEKEQAMGEAVTATVDIERERTKVEDLTMRLKYMQADLENLRKRTDKEVKEAGTAAVRDLAVKLLVVLDELDLATKHAEEEETQFVEGIKMVRRNLSGALESVGVQRIECVGATFDPAIHEAVEKVDGEGEKEDVVVEELRPGYLIGGQLLRPSMVKVQLATRGRAEEARANE